MYRKFFSTVFHNGDMDKPIVSFYVKVNSTKRLKALNKQGRKNLLSTLEYFEESLSRFKKEVKK